MADPFLYSSCDAATTADPPPKTGSARTHTPPANRALATDVHRLLTSAGLRLHTFDNPGGGFAITRLLDGDVLVDWVPTDHHPHDVEPFEISIRNIMQPTIAAILKTHGFTATLIPQGQDDAECLWVTASPRADTTTDQWITPTRPPAARRPISGG